LAVFQAVVPPEQQTTRTNTSRRIDPKATQPQAVPAAAPRKAPAIPTPDPVTTKPFAIESVFLKSKPSKAQVFLDGRVIGETPMKVELDAEGAAMLLTLKRTGYIPVERLVSSGDGNILIRLKRRSVRPTRQKSRRNSSAGKSTKKPSKMNAPKKTKVEMW
jgi:hypothetical protein